MANKIKEFTSKTGKKYTFQKVSPSQWAEMLDNGEIMGRIKRTIFYPSVLESVVVQPPNMKMDDFEEYEEMDEVVTAAIRFQSGK